MTTTADHYPTAPGVLLLFSGGFYIIPAIASGIANKAMPTKEP